jgi:hypothetical protein
MNSNVIRCLGAFGTLVVVAFLGYTFSGCRVIKSSRVSSYKDSVAVHDTVRIGVAMYDSVVHERLVHDTVIGQAGFDLSLVLPENTPALKGDMRNEAMIDTSVKVASGTLHVYRDMRGRTHIDCKADSLTLVLHNVIEERDRLISRGDSSYTEGQSSTSSLRSVVYSRVEERYPLWRRVIDWLIAAFVGVIVWEIGKKARQLLMVNC